MTNAFDQLSDHLAEYYRAILGGLADSTEDLLNALIMGGEPCTQSQLAERVGQTQSGIATAFKPLTESRIVVGGKAIGGRGMLYRVRDRLFVYYYRKRFGIRSDASTLIRVSELLAAFFAAEERTERPPGSPSSESTIVDCVAKAVEKQGRSEAYSQFVTMVNAGFEQKSLGEVDDGIRRLVSGITSRINDSGFLRDVADYLEDGFQGHDTKSSTHELRVFADFHDAEKPPAFLQQIDPDLKTVILRIWCQ